MIDLKVVNFREDYSKLNKKEFSTIRLSDTTAPDWKYEIGEICIIKSPSQCFKAKVIERDCDYLESYNESFLTKDTDTKTKNEAINHLKGYYPDLEDMTELSVYFFERCNLKCPECDPGELIRFGSRKQVNYKCNNRKCNSFFSDRKLKELGVL